jgi:hypothetical protein
MAICPVCKHDISGPVILLDNREVCRDCFWSINRRWGRFQIPRFIVGTKYPEPLPPRKPGFFGWTFNEDAKQDYHNKMREYERLKEIFEQECNRIRELNREFDEIAHDICSFWPGGFVPPDWEWRRERVVDRDAGKCQKCGRPSRYLKYRDQMPKKPSTKTRKLIYSLGDLDVHHVIPKSKGGTHEFSNLILLCRKCHRKKSHGKTAFEKAAPGAKRVLTLNVTEALPPAQKRTDDTETLFQTGTRFWGTDDYVEAVKWYRKDAEQGYANAQYEFGICYREGRGVPQDYVEAVKWFRKVREQDSMFVV